MPKWNIRRISLQANPLLNKQAAAAAESGRYQEAIDLLTRAIELEPELVVAHYNLGRIYDTQGRFGDATAAFKQALQLNPGFTKAHYYMGVSYNKTKKYAEAIRQQNSESEIKKTVESWIHEFKEVPPSNLRQAVSSAYPSLNSLRMPAIAHRTTLDNFRSSEPFV